MTKFKIKPTQKENWRYIAFEIYSQNQCKQEEVTKALVNNTLRLLGEIGASYANLWVIDFDQKKQSGIVRCSRDAQTQIVADLTTITHINQQQAAMFVLGVSGTLKKLKDKYLNTRTLKQNSKIKKEEN